MESPEIDAAIKQTSDIAQELGITGTPVFIVDATVNVGLLRHEELSQLVNEARKAGCQIC
jgi:protein-disulfide isomerase